jgi:hypothetical protein
MSYVKQRTTAEQRLALRMVWSATTKESHSAEFLAVIFDVSRPTVLNICASTPRLGDRYPDDHVIVRAGWEQDRQRKLLPVTDQDWTRAIAEAQTHIGQRLAASRDACVALIQRAAA